MVSTTTVIVAGTPVRVQASGPFSSPVAHAPATTPDAPARRVPSTPTTPLPVLVVPFYNVPGTPPTPEADRAPAAPVARRLRRRDLDSDSDEDFVVPHIVRVRASGVNRQLTF